MCHNSATPMGHTAIRELKHETTAVLERVAAGETLEVRRRNEVVAVLSPARPEHPNMPDFAARLQEIWGDQVLPSFSELISESRGDR